VQEIELTLANIGSSLVSVATLGASTSPNGRSVIRIVVASSWKSRSPALPVGQTCLRRMVVVNHREKTDAEPSPIRLQSGSGSKQPEAGVDLSLLIRDLRQNYALIHIATPTLI
jgi:hypothetical protein